jgi:hypothetical protein
MKEWTMTLITAFLFSTGKWIWGGVNHLGLWAAFPDGESTSAQPAWWPECLISLGPERTGCSDRMP